MFEREALEERTDPIEQIGREIKLFEPICESIVTSSLFDDSDLLKPNTLILTIDYSWDIDFIDPLSFIIPSYIASSTFLWL